MICGALIAVWWFHVIGDRYWTGCILLSILSGAAIAAVQVYLEDK